jgi:hypothetical protein
MASAFISFLITFVGLAIIVGMIFIALDRIAKDEFMKRIGKIAVGGCAVLILLIGLHGVFFGGGAEAISPKALIEFAIGVIVLIVVFYLIDMAVTMWLAAWAGPVNYVLCALMLIILLVLAGQALFGGGLGLISSAGFPRAR